MDEQRSGFRSKLPHDLNLDNKPEYLLDLVSKAIALLVIAEKKNLRKATAVYLFTMVSSFGATVCLGLPTSVAPEWFKAAAFVLSAAVTFLNGVEPFFGYRNQAFHQRQAYSGLYRLADEIGFLFAGRQPADIPEEKLDEFFDRYERIWKDLNQKFSTQQKLTPGTAGAEPSPTA